MTTLSLALLLRGGLLGGLEGCKPRLSKFLEVDGLGSPKITPGRSGRLSLSQLSWGPIISYTSLVEKEKTEFVPLFHSLLQALARLS